jgi:hypothetical protein
VSVRHVLLALTLALGACSGSFSLDDAEAPTDDVAETDFQSVGDTDRGDTDPAGDTDVVDDTDTDAAGDTDAPPPPTDRCANEADLAALAAAADTLPQTVEDCTVGCLGHRPIGACVTRCLVDEAALSGACASCFGEEVGCVVNQCLRECVDPASQDCADCRTAKCEPRFETCSGVQVP